MTVDDLYNKFELMPRIGVLEKKMKKCIFVFLIFCLFFSDFKCNVNKSNHLNTSSKNAKSQADYLVLIILKENIKFNERIIADLNDDIMKLKKEKMDILLQLSAMAENKINLNDTSLYENHKIDYILEFGEYGPYTELFLFPESEKEIYILQAGDTFKISNVIHLKNSNKNFIKGSTQHGITGFIEISKNPYENGNFEIIGSLEVEGKKINLLQINNTVFDVYANTKMRYMPSNNSEIVHEVTDEESWKIIIMEKTSITADYKWIKISLGEYTGWVTRDSLWAGRGGPILDIPEVFIEWDIIGGA